ncbi:MAG: hypothetical protein K9G36_04025 [Crocinitomicaceae bacterium]|nr:hypothetical protein [Crocinitomicaceae bacterium]MCF8410121.1 hypothetical protein [Crocinitomicaceae bacterium]
MTLTRDAQINYLNISLMFLSAIGAFFLPFEVFLFAYAFLGPLHYLTEISWLHDRNYFSKGKYDFIVLVIIGVLLSYAAFAKDFGVNTDFYEAFVEANLFDKLLVLALFSAIIFALVENLIVKIISILFLFVFISGWLSPERSADNNASTTVFALTSLLPTLIHVYVFTGLFMLYGALKSRSKTGLISVATFIVIPIILVFYTPVDPKTNFLSDFGKKAYYADGDGFFYTNVSILDHFKLIDEPLLTNKQYLDSVVNKKSADNQIPVAERARITDSLKNKLAENFIVPNQESEYYNKPIPVKFAIPINTKEYYWNSIFFSTFGIMLMRFIAFAYLYHYLNWFSKTEVIRWHKVPKIRFALVIGLWLTACGLYAYDYALGLSFLFFLSFSHVLLEFPLNIVSIVGIGKETLSIVKHGFTLTTKK